MNRQATYHEAMAAGRDAGNRLMRKKWPMTAWDEECAQVAAETFHRLCGYPPPTGPNSHPQ